MRNKSSPTPCAVRGRSGESRPGNLIPDSAKGGAGGVYQLHLYLPRAVRVQIGRLGAFEFPRGHYVYTGSALGGLEARLARHLRREKKLHWHIDYLLRYATIQRISCVPTRRRLECEWNRRTLRQRGAQVIAEGFGSSDCNCRTHLVHLAKELSRFLCE